MEIVTSFIVSIIVCSYFIYRYERRLDAEQKAFLEEVTNIVMETIYKVKHKQK